MSLTIDHSLNSIASSTQVVTINTTGALVVSKGSTAQRPVSPVTGMLRYNTTNTEMEYYNGAWQSVGSGGGGGSSDDALVFAIVFGR